MPSQSETRAREAQAAARECQDRGIPYVPWDLAEAQSWGSVDPLPTLDQIPAGWIQIDFSRDIAAWSVGGWYRELHAAYRNHIIGFAYTTFGTIAAYRKARA